MPGASNDSVTANCTCPVSTYFTGIGGICPVGHYCPNGTKYHDEFPCPVGTFRASQQGHSDSDCTQCTGGSYCGTEGLAAPTALCDAGMYFFSFVFNELSKIELLTKNVC